MSRTLKVTLLLSVFVAACLLLTGTGCKKEEPPKPETIVEQAETAVKEAVASIDLCTKCGQVKGTAECCKPDAKKCDGCGLAKGSPGCCKIPKDVEKVTLCTKCGQIKGTAECCKPDAEKCAKCGLAKGSPGCCKLPK